MVRQFLVAAIMTVVAAPAVAQHMNAETFYQRATKLKGKGALALFSGGEIKALMKEGQASGKASSIRYREDKAAGRQVRFCPPKGPTKMGSDEFMSRLGAIPQSERRAIDMTEATTRIMASKFPCSKTTG